MEKKDLNLNLDLNFVASALNFLFILNPLPTTKVCSHFQLVTDKPSSTYLPPIHTHIYSKIR